jgi:hypothetical protein
VVIEQSKSRWEQLDDEYRRVFGEGGTYTNIFMTEEKDIAIMEEALATGKPYYNDVPEGAII